MKWSFFATILISSILVACNNNSKQTTDNDMEQKLGLTQEWDKVFPLSDKVCHKKVTFKTQYGMTLAADLYTPKDGKGKMAAIAVSSPFGAVKEQCSGLYAEALTEQRENAVPDLKAYVPHNLSGVMAVNKPTMSEEPVWVKAAKNK